MKSSKLTASNNIIVNSQTKSFPLKDVVQHIKDDTKDNNCTQILINSEPEDYVTQEVPVPPPDGGFGWIVVLASFMCNFIVDGIIFSFGILLIEISNEFHETKASTAWIGSLQGGFYLILGPIVSALANIYGCRKTTIFGSLVAAIGFILSFFAGNVKTLYFTFGILGGIGFGFIFLPAIVMVGFYFEKRRAFATGIAVCGSGIGNFVFAPATQLLVEYYGWRGCVLILAGITLNCAVFGSLFRPVEHLQNKSQKPLLFRIKEARDALWTESDMDEVEEDSPTGSHNSAPPPYSEIVNIDNTNNNSLAKKYSLSINNSVTEMKNRRRTQSYDYTNQFLRPEVISSSLSLVAVRSRSSSVMSHVLERSANRLPSIKSVTESKERSTPEESTQSKESIHTSNESNSANQSSKACFEFLTQTFDLTLLKSPSFLLLSLSGFLCLAGFFIPFMYIANRAKLLGCTPEKSAFLLSIIGITNTIGRVFCGYISDRPQVNALLINNVALTIGGLATILSPIICNTYVTLMIYSAIFGFSIACFAALRSVITAEMLGLDRLANAFGLLLMFQGIAVTIGSPIAGWFFDITGSYDYSFYLSGSAIALAGIMCFPLSAISRWERQKPGFGAIN
ncbi:monocarboxylate transporter 14-like [Oppia nitens]|uniref:monocarboxylate transporter 14-like n=1 Tax=Oppia nitens TaxID=1686743 RepID=UPI0023DCCFE5|nr:monocarboxylate transporter 14-like [Oppia nitens]